MKRCTFISVIRKYNGAQWVYDVVYDIKPNQPFSELVGSLNKFEKIEIVDFKNLESDVNLFVSFFCVDTDRLF
jgi:hypothetical protein